MAKHVRPYSLPDCTVFTRKSGKYAGQAVGRYHYRDQAGRDQYATCQGKTEQDCWDRLPAVIAKVAARVLYVADQKQAQAEKTFGAFVQECFAGAYRTKLKPATYALYEFINREYLGPIQAVPLAELTAVQIEPCYNVIGRRINRPLAYRTKRNVLRFVSRVLADAKRYKLVATNEAENCVIHDREPDQQTAHLTAEQVQRVLAAMDNPTMHRLFWLQVNTGMRISEVCGLKWADYCPSDEPGESCLQLRQQVQRNRLIAKQTKPQRLALKAAYEAERGQILAARQAGRITAKRKKALHSQAWARYQAELAKLPQAVAEQDLKTAKSASAVWLPDELKPTIEAQRGNGSQYIFCTAKKTPFEARNCQRALERACAKAGLPKIGTHGFGRHTFGYLQGLADTPLEVIQSMLRHTDPRTTLRYRKTAPETMQKAAKRLAGILKTG